MTALAEAQTQSPRGSRSDKGRGTAVLLAGIDRPLEDFAPVLALTLLSENGPAAREILVGVRNPAANKTHQDVASVPTRRVPLVLAEAWIDQLRRSRLDEVAARLDLRSEVANIFSRKLGLADPLELGLVRFTVVRLEGTQGISVIGEDEDGAVLTENLTMFNVCVVLEEGRDNVPKATASYDPLMWGTVDNFLAMIATYDAGQFDAGLDGIFVCAYGLCLLTSAHMLENTGLASDKQPSTWISSGVEAGDWRWPGGQRPRLQGPAARSHSAGERASGVLR